MIMFKLLKRVSRQYKLSHNEDARKNAEVEKGKSLSYQGKWDFRHKNMKKNVFLLT